jgi:small subunit ribosomal protein S2
MKPYIFGKRNGIHIIDLRQTLRGIIKARRFLEQIAGQGQSILFVGTKRQAAGIVRRDVGERGLPYVADRWLGGMLTNFQTVRRSLGRLEELERLEQTGEMKLYTKKMIAMLQREKTKILRNLGGIRALNRMPAAMVIIDPRRDKIALAEAIKLRIPVVALLDTDCDPKDIDIPIPCNDDSIRSIQVILGQLVASVEQGQQAIKGALPEEKPAPRPAAPPAPQERGLAAPTA